jgi:hypothetical protein
MSKGRRRNAWAAQAARKRNPAAWFTYPAASPKFKGRRHQRPQVGRKGA